MAFGLGCQQLPTAKSAAGLAHRPLQYRSRTFVKGGLRTVRSLESLYGTDPSRRCHPCQVLAFGTEELHLAKQETSVTDSIAHRSSMVRYRFVVPQYVTTFGQTLRVVGSLPELGGWDPHLAPLMAWSDGHQWSLECALPQRSFEFKITVFEGHGIKWEFGNNRVVHVAEEDGEGGGIPVEIVVWLTCQFNATTSTQLQLAVPRASIQDAYETGRATLEFLRLRKLKLGQDAEQSAGPEERRRQAVELARLSEAVLEQSRLVHQLSDLLGHDEGTERTEGRRHGPSNAGGNSDGNSEEDDEVRLLLLAMDSVRLPRTLRRISFMQSWTPGAGPAELPHAVHTGGGGGSSASTGNANGNGVAHGEAMAPAVVSSAAPTSPSSPFLRGELDSRAEDLMDAAEVLLQDLKSTSASGTPQEAALAVEEEWASLAQEAGQVAMALQALGGGGGGSGDGDGRAAASAHAMQLQMRGLATVGSALASGGGGGCGTAVEETRVARGAGTAEATAEEEEKEEALGPVPSIQMGMLPAGQHEGVPAGAEGLATVGEVVAADTAGTEQRREHQDGAADGGGGSGDGAALPGLWAKAAAAGNGVGAAMVGAAARDIAPQEEAGVSRLRTPAAAVEGPSSLPGSAVKEAVAPPSGRGDSPAGGVPQPQPEAAAGPEAEATVTAPKAHPLRQLTSTFTDAVRMTRPPSFSKQAVKNKTQLAGPHSAAETVAQQQQQLTSATEPSSSPEPSGQRPPPPQQQQAPVTADSRWPWPRLAVNLRAFLDNLFL